MNIPYTPDKYIAALATVERYVTETAIAAAPILGLLPAAIISAVHCNLYLHFGPVASPLVGAGVEAVSIAIVATRVLLPGKGLKHRERDMDRAFVGYIIVLATVNMGLNIANLPSTPASWGQGLAELALGLLAIPVAWLVATRHEIATVQADKDTADAKATGLRTEQDAKDAKIREENRAHELTVLKLQLEADALEKDKKRASKLAQAEKQVAQVATPETQVETSPVQGHVDLVLLASKLAQVPPPTNKALGKFFGVSGEAVRLARKKL